MAAQPPDQYPQQQQQPQKPPDPKSTILIGAVILGLSLWGYSSVYKEYLGARNSANWPTVEGTSRGSLLRQNNYRKGRETWTVDVRYTYTIDGKEYEGDQIRFGGFPSTSSSEEAEATKAKYKAASTHKVYYKPGDPETAVLEPGVGAALSALSLGALALLFPFALGLWTFISGIQMLNEQRARAR